MANELSAYSENYLAKVVAAGLFPSKQAALEAAVAALREKNEEPAMVPAEHLERVEEGLASANAGRSRELADADWERIRESVRDRASAPRRNG
jgi:hypothetical protein